MTSEEQAGTSSARQQEAPPGAAAGGPPDDPEELKQEIERTREQLGETVEALAAKADVKAQAQAKAGQVAERLKSRAAQARRQAAATTTGQLQGRERRVQLVVAAGAVVLAWLLITRWRQR
jgi:Protein of unknown function (DUF3618)